MRGGGPDSECGESGDGGGWVFKEVLEGYREEAVGSCVKGVEGLLWGRDRV